jgi:hypothetical protein
MWDLWWTKWHWDRLFSEYCGFPLSISSTGAPLHGKMKKADHLYLHLHHKGCTISLKAAVHP